VRHAYFVHHEALEAYNNAKTPLEKTAIARTYFELSAPIVDSEMKKKLEEEMK